ncbi:MAG: YhfC family glutamic-type intramembrane protease, partial [Lachnospiraceae bacterium]|nr:YhfC family glutamic-type intramembrane protease [Lachnospiraceae bacterium]
RTVLRKYMDRNINAVMYGAGHGGFEAAVILGMTMVNNLMWSFMINSGRTQALTGGYTGEVLEQIQTSIRELCTTPSWQFLLAGLERILAVIIQIALSVLVWFAVKNKKRRYLFPAAILIHMAVDAGAVLLAQTDVPLPAVEAVIALAAAAVAFCARSIYQAEEAADRSE